MLTINYSLVLFPHNLDTDDENKEADKRPDVTEILTWTLINSMPCILHHHKIACEHKDIPKNKLKDTISNEMQRIEAITCKDYAWDINEYYAEIERKQNDPEMIKLFSTIEQLIEQTIKGEKLVVNFNPLPELTKEIILSLYKWIMLSNAYMNYQNGKELGISLKMDKAQRRKDLTKRFNLRLKEDETCSMTLQRAYFTFRVNDEEFDKKAKEIVDLKRTLDVLFTTEVVIPEFEKDPFEMSKEEMETLYTKMMKAYVFVSDDYDEENPSEQNESEEEDEELLIELDSKNEIAQESSNDAQLALINDNQT